MSMTVIILVVALLSYAISGGEQDFIDILNRIYITCIIGIILLVVVIFYSSKL